MTQCALQAFGRFAAEAGELVISGGEFAGQHSAGPFRHGVVSAGEHIHCGVARFRPGVNGDMGFGQQGQTGDPLGVETVGDQVEEGGTSTLRSGRDGVPEEGFVVEPGGVTAVELKDAVFSDGVGDLGG